MRREEIVTIRNLLNISCLMEKTTYYTNISKQLKTLKVILYFC
jgi:hypothetical protein